MAFNFVKKSILTVSAVALLAACSNDDAAPSADADASKVNSRFVTIATGGASGPYNIIATTLSEIYADKHKTNSKTQTTGASVENINLIHQGKAEMAFLMSDVLSQAVNGEGPFPNKIENVNQMAVLYP